MFNDSKGRKESCSVSALCKYVGYVFGFGFVTSAGVYFLELVSRLKRLLLHYDNFSDTNILEELNTCMLQSVILRGFLHFSSQFSFSEDI